MVEGLTNFKRFGWDIMTMHHLYGWSYYHLYGWHISLDWWFLFNVFPVLDLKCVILWIVIELLLSDWFRATRPSASDWHGVWMTVASSCSLSWTLGYWNTESKSWMETARLSRHPFCQISSISSSCPWNDFLQCRPVDYTCLAASETL